MKKPTKWTEELENRWDKLVIMDCLQEKMTQKEQAELKRLSKWRSELLCPRTPREKAYDKAIQKSFDKMMRAIKEHIQIQKDFSNGK